jgi:glycosyltransferase involved in cell wall biosynthesis
MSYYPLSARVQERDYLNAAQRLLSSHSRRRNAAGIDNAVEFKGVLPREQLAAEFQEANVFCLPSLREGFPMSLIEAMAFSLPVVATPVGAVPEIVRNDVTGLLVDVGSCDAIAAALERLVDPGLRTRLGEAGARQVRLQCDPTPIRRRWGDLYAEVSLIDP